MCYTYIKHVFVIVFIFALSIIGYFVFLAPLDDGSNYVNKTKCSIHERRLLNILIVSIHDGARVDLPSILTSMGHHIILHSLKMDDTPYPLAFEIYNFSINPYDVLSPYGDIKEKWENFDESDILNMYKFYTKTENRYILDPIDLIICSYPAATLCESWIPFNKSILINSGHRYDHRHSKTNKNKWNLLNRNMKYLLNANNHLGFNKYMIAGNNVYDNYYINYFLNDDNRYKNYFINNYIPTSGVLYTNLYLNNDPQFEGYINYTLYHENITIKSLRKQEILIGPIDIGIGAKAQSQPTINKILYYFNHPNKFKFKFMTLRQRYERFEAYDLIKHRAIILLPYSVHSYGITDIYSLNIPTFVPSIEFLYDNHIMYDVGNEQRFNKPKARNNTYLGQYPKPLKQGKMATFEQFKFWVHKSDCFTWKHFIYFDSLQHLDELLHDVMQYPSDYIHISHSMKRFNEEKLKVIKNKIDEMLSPIQQRPTSLLPNVSYHKAIKRILHNDSIEFLQTN